MWDIYGAAVSDNEKERKRNLWGQIHRMITHRTDPLQGSEVAAVTDLLTGCNDVNRDTGQREISIFKPISLVFVDDDLICSTCIL